MVSERRVALYVNRLRESVWPSEKNTRRPLSGNSFDEKMQRRREAEALLLKKTAPLAAIIGESQLQESIQELFTCMQYPTLNRQFMFVVIDMLVLNLFPEMHSREIVRRLANEIDLS